MRPTLLNLLMCIGLAAAASAHAAGVTDQMIETEASASGNVLSWGGAPQGQRYSPLKQITTANVGKLAPVWAFFQGAGSDEWAGCAMFGRKQIHANGWCNAWAKKPA